MKNTIYTSSKRFCIQASSSSSSSSTTYSPILLPICTRRYNSTATAPKKEYISSTPTYYTLFPKTLPDGPPPSGPFTFNPRTLRTEFLKKQQSTHPDLFPPSHRSKAEAQSSHLNKAYTTLLDPLLRAQYLLRLREIDVEDETSKLAEGDQELLMEVMEAREEIEEVEEEEELEELVNRNEERITGSVSALERYFGEDDLEGARREAVRLRYWVNIKDTLRGWEKGGRVVLHH